MKAILFFSVLFFSSASYAELFRPNTGFADNPLGGHYHGCSATSCVEGYRDPYIDYYTLDPGDEINNDSYFTISGGLVDRRMSTGIDYHVFDNVELLVEWDTFDVFDARLTFGGAGYGSNSLMLPGTGSGSFLLSLMVPFTYDYFDYSFAIYGMANSLDSFIEYRFSVVQPPSEVPLPASLFLFAPALLGLIGLRRKLS